MEKKAVIEDGLTPPESREDGQKQADVDSLEDHVTKRAADQAEQNAARKPRRCF